MRLVLVYLIERAPCIAQATAIYPLNQEQRIRNPALSGLIRFNPANFAAGFQTDPLPTGLVKENRRPQTAKARGWQRICMAFDVMSTRNTKSKPQPTDAAADALTWVGLILAAALALVVAVQSTPSLRGLSSGDQTEAAAN